jgi:hypothetical protein
VDVTPIKILARAVGKKCHQGVIDVVSEPSAPENCESAAVEEEWVTGVQNEELIDIGQSGRMKSLRNLFQR